MSIPTLLLTDFLGCFQFKATVSKVWKGKKENGKVGTFQALPRFATKKHTTELAQEVYWEKKKPGDGTCF